VLQDLRYSLHLIAKTPAFDWVFRPVPFPGSDSLLALTETSQVKQASGWTSPRDYLDWKDQNHVFANMAAWSPAGHSLTSGGEPERVPGMEVTASFFAVVGVKPLLGRSFVSPEDVPKDSPVAVLSHSLWQRRFGGKPDILGQTIAVNGKPFGVIGVMPLAAPPQMLRETISNVRVDPSEGHARIAKFEVVLPAAQVPVQFRN